MAQPFAHGAIGPAIRSFAITANDSTDLTDHIRSLTINSSGVVKYTAWDDSVCTTATLPAGTYAMLAKRIWATGTTVTAGGLTGWV